MLRYVFLFDEYTERCESGRIGVPGEHVCWQRHRGFKSHPLRQKKMVLGWDLNGVLKGLCPFHEVQREGVLDARNNESRLRTPASR